MRVLLRSTVVAEPFMLLLEAEVSLLLPGVGIELLLLDVSFEGLVFLLELLEGTVLLELPLEELSLEVLPP